MVKATRNPAIAETSGCGAGEIAKREGGGTGHRRRHVDFGPEQDRGLAGQQIAQDAAEGGGQHAGDDGDGRRAGRSETLGGAHHGVGGESDRVEPQQQLPARLHHVGAEEDQNADRRADQHIGRVLHPEHRRAEDQVAERAAADAGDASQEQEADHVELLARGGKRAGRGEHGDAGIVEIEDRIHGSPPARPGAVERIRSAAAWQAVAGGKSPRDRSQASRSACSLTGPGSAGASAPACLGSLPAAACFGPPLATPTMAGLSTRSPIE